VRISFDPQQIGFGQNLQVYFSAASNPEQARIAKAYIAQLYQADLICKKSLIYLKSMIFLDFLIHQRRFVKPCLMLTQEREQPLQPTAS
jgi:hypothetical protein